MKTIHRNILIIFTGALVFISCSSKPKDAVKQDGETLPDSIVELSADQFKVAGVEFGAVVPKNLSTTLKVNGLITVSPKDFASVCAPLGGFVKNTEFVQGSPVKIGQTLAIMENPSFIELQQNWLESKSRLEYAEGEYKRHKELFEDDVYSAKNLQEVTANYKSLKAQVNAIGQKLSLIGINANQLKDDNISSTVSVNSPISGYVKAVNVNIGKFVGPEEVMFEIVNTANLTIELTLFEKDINKVAIGQKLSFTLSNEGLIRYTAIITQVGKSIADDRTVKVYARVSEPTDRILPGMFVNALIETAASPVAALPSDAIVQFDEKDYIFVYSKEKKEKGKPFTEFRIVEVKKGVSDNGFTEIILPEGFDMKTMKVVIKGAYNLMAAKKNAGDMAC